MIKKSVYEKRKEKGCGYPRDKCMCGNLKTKSAKSCRDCFDKNNRKQLSRLESLK